MSDGILRAEGLVVRRGPRVVLDGVDLSVAAGEVVAVLGPNGAGKSTLLSALAGLLPPLAGSVHCDGRVAAALQAPALARRTAQANVEAALAWWGVPRSGRRGRALEALTALRADHLAKRMAPTLSGGEARRVHLARALAVAPDALLLDEPFAGLDPETRSTLLYDVASAIRAPDRATLVVVHDRAEAWALADRIVVLLDGQVAADGPPREVLERPPSIEVAQFLGFSGRLEEPGGAVRLLRPRHVRVHADGESHATVQRVVPLEDGARIELALANGFAVAEVDLPAPQVGATVRVSIDGGTIF